MLFSVEKIYQTRKTTLPNTSPDVRQKYSAACHIFNSLLSVKKTMYFVFDIIYQNFTLKYNEWMTCWGVNHKTNQQRKRIKKPSCLNRAGAKPEPKTFQYSSLTCHSFSCFVSPRRSLQANEPDVLPWSSPSRTDLMVKNSTSSLTCRSSNTLRLSSLKFLWR